MQRDGDAQVGHSGTGQRGRERPDAVPAVQPGHQGPPVAAFDGHPLGVHRHVHQPHRGAEQQQGEDQRAEVPGEPDRDQRRRRGGPGGDRRRPAAPPGDDPPREAHGGDDADRGAQQGDAHRALAQPEVLLDLRDADHPGGRDQPVRRERRRHGHPRATERRDLVRDHPADCTRPRRATATHWRPARPGRARPPDRATGSDQPAVSSRDAVRAGARFRPDRDSDQGATQVSPRSGQAAAQSAPRPGAGLSRGQGAAYVRAERDTSGSASRVLSTRAPERISAWTSPVTSHTLTFIPATTRPPDSQNTTNSREATSPRYTTSSYSPGAATPDISIPRSYWSLKKYGIRS